MSRRKRGSTNSEPFVRNYHKTAEKVGVDLDALHVFLWSKADRQGKLLLTQTKVGEMLDLYPMLVSRVFKALESDGRVRKAGKVIFVRDPDVWKWDGNSRHSS